MAATLRSSLPPSAPSSDLDSDGSWVPPPLKAEPAARATNCGPTVSEALDPYLAEKRDEFAADRGRALQVRRMRSAGSSRSLPQVRSRSGDADPGRRPELPRLSRAQGSISRVCEEEHQDRWSHHCCGYRRASRPRCMSPDLGFRCSSMSASRRRRSTARRPALIFLDRLSNRLARAGSLACMAWATLLNSANSSAVGVAMN